MAPKLDESQTEFMPKSSTGSFFTASGRLGKFLSKFFASKTQPFVNTQSTLGQQHYIL